MLRFSGFSAAIIVSLLVAGCDASSATPREKITISGSSTIAPVASEMAKAYELIYKNTRVDVQSGGSSRGINDVRSGNADIGMVSRKLSSDEKDLSSVLVGWDGIALIVHKENPISNLRSEDVVKIYRKEVTNWSEFGGPDLPITVVNKAEGRSTLDIFSQYFVLESDQIKADLIIGENRQGIEAVGGNPGSIGYVSIGSSEYEAGKGSNIKLIALNGIAPSTATVAQRKYPIVRELNYVFRSPVRPEVAEFLNFATTDKGQKVVVDQLFVGTKM